MSLGVSEGGFTRSVPELGWIIWRLIAATRQAIKRCSTDIEVSEATYSCKIEFIDILGLKISFNILNYLVF